MWVKATFLLARLFQNNSPLFVAPTSSTFDFWSTATSLIFCDITTLLHLRLHYQAEQPNHTFDPRSHSNRHHRMVGPIHPRTEEYDISLPDDFTVREGDGIQVRDLRLQLLYYRIIVAYAALLISTTDVLTSRINSASAFPLLFRGSVSGTGNR